MLAIAAFFMGFAIGIGVLATVGRALGTAPELGGWTLAFGVTAAVAFVATGLLHGLPEIALTTGLVSIALAFAGVFVGIGGLLRGVRRWPLWVGLVSAGAPAVMWLSVVMSGLRAS